MGSEVDDAYLVRRAQEGYVDAYADLVDRHGLLAYRVALRLLGNHQAQFGFCNGSGTTTSIVETLTPTGTIVTNDWLQLVFTTQEVA